MKKINKTPLAAAMGSAVLSTLAMTAAHAEVNPFGMTELSSGYMQLAETHDAGAAKPKEGACGEGKCGGMMKGKSLNNKMDEGTCASAKPKAGDKNAEAKCGEGKCGEGKCGGMMENGKMKKGMEGACGEMMKGKEGACGQMNKEEPKK